MLFSRPSELKCLLKKKLSLCWWIKCFYWYWKWVHRLLEYMYSRSPWRVLTEIYPHKNLQIIINRGSNSVWFSKTFPANILFFIHSQDVSVLWFSWPPTYSTFHLFISCLKYETSKTNYGLRIPSRPWTNITILTADIFSELIETFRSHILSFG